MHHRTLRSSLAALAAFAVIAAPAMASADQFIPGELVVQFHPNVPDSLRAFVLSKIGGAVAERIHTPSMKSIGYQPVLRVTTTRPVIDAIRIASSFKEVRIAEPNWIYTTGETSNDPYYTGGNLWGMYGDNTSPTNQFGSRAGEAWGLGHIGSSSTIVAVIDEGVQYTHPDIDANGWVNPYEAADGIDNDGNGYVDDIRGWDFHKGDNTVYDSTQDDHGTHVTGTICAEGGNGAGVAGVVWRAKYITCKFLGPMGGSTTNAIKAFDYVTDLKTRHGLDIVASNNSWGGGGYSQALKDAIDRHGAANILAMCAAGNGGSDGVGDDNDTTPHYPSSYSSSNIIAVASINSSGGKSGFSNYGATSVDLGAPGSGIYSTVPSNSYKSYSGTSMATPHVTGGALLYAATRTARGLTLKDAILGATIPTSSLSGKCVTGGRLNVESF